MLPFAYFANINPTNLHTLFIEILNTNSVQILLGKWLNHIDFFTGDIIEPLCISGLSEILISEYKIINNLKIKLGANLLSIPAAILKVIIKYFDKKYDKNNTDNEIKENMDDTLDTKYYFSENIGIFQI